MIVDLDELAKTGKVKNANGLLAHRHVTIKKCLELFQDVRPKIMVETGCQHNNLLHAHGLSTSIFGAVAKKYDALLYTIDLNEDHILECMKLTDEYKDYIDYQIIDSLLFFNSYDYDFYKPIDFLYLDSCDFTEGNEEESRLHQLNEIKSALHLMNDKSIILLDDANVSMWFDRKLSDKDIEGKTYYAHRFLLESGAKCLIDSYQRLYLLEK